ncbi:HTH-type transcriptional activator RhaR [Sporomusa silvacetica DSM 10669]|uniref:HTH-type transcriptional activator RhaR n=1 Tax=Sporomusa silvacetica DSM 10669 TaxID=1123289 RepID=A0ABZ3IS25_9FIRM|nr:AraC family transcriptional regulator [Sporomusa silvacetica]OZC20669.1 bifunctional transcriptional activator/DNA repair enzyme AdaA [Sporomusa silvacetica DSM 10669]
MGKRQTESGTIHFADYRKTLGVELVYGYQITHAFTRHTHRTLGFGLVEQGVRLYSCLGESYQITPGQFFVIPPNSEHSCSTVNRQPHTYRLLLLSNDVLQASGLISDEYNYICKQLVISNTDAYNRLRQLHDKLDSDETEFIKKSLLLSIVGYLFENYIEAPIKVELSSYHYENIKMIQKFIEANYAACFSLEDVAQLAHISPYHLLRLFSQIVGIPPHVYQQQVRIRQAKQLLSQGSSIFDTAMSTGFADQSHFTKVFKRMVGITPGEYKVSFRFRRGFNPAEV